MTALVALAILQRPAPIADLPFKYEPGRICLKGMLYGQAVRTMLDSGAGGIIVSEEAAARAGGTKGTAFQSNTIGGPSFAWLASGMSLGLRGAPMTTAANAIVSFGKTASGNPIDVAAGFPLFSVFGVQIDYVNSRVRIYSPSQFVPAAEVR